LKFFPTIATFFLILKIRQIFVDESIYITHTV
jgi:hypothetical protein